jgi:hypothetical protein
VSGARAQLDALLAGFCAAQGVPLSSLNEAGYTELKTARGLVRVNLIEPHHAALILAPIMSAPEHGGASLYRRLLELSFLATGTAAFAVDKKTDQIYLRALVLLEGLDVEAFELMLAGVVDDADALGESLRRQFGGL